MSKYTIGIDFGTLSARAIVVDVSNGEEKEEEGEGGSGNAEIFGERGGISN